jgi:hypothetical protein
MFLQVFILDHINFLDVINPMIYLLFVLLLPINLSTPIYLLIAFAYGLLLDGFQDTGGAHAAACLTLAFSRSALLRLVYGESYQLKNLKIITSSIDRQLLLVALAVLIHHLVFYSLIIFDGSHLLLILKYTTMVGLASVLVSFLMLVMLRPKKRS